MDCEELFICEVLSGFCPDLVLVQDLKEGFVDVGLALEAVLNLVDVADGVVELHGLVVLQRQGGGHAVNGGVGLQRGRTRGRIRRDGRIGMTARSQSWRLQWLYTHTERQRETDREKNISDADRD